MNTSTHYSKRPSMDVLIALHETYTAKEVAAQYDVSVETVRGWYRQARKDFIAEHPDADLSKESLFQIPRGRNAVVPSDEELLDMHGLSNADIARKYGVKPSTVCRWYVELRKRCTPEQAALLEERRNRHRLSVRPSDEELIRRKNQPSSVIAKEYGVSTAAVHKWYERLKENLTEAGDTETLSLVFPRHPGSRGKKPSYEELLNMQYMSPSEVAAKYDVQLATARRWFSDAGLHLRRESSGRGKRYSERRTKAKAKQAERVQRTAVSDHDLQALCALARSQSIVPGLKFDVDCETNSTYRLSVNGRNVERKASYEQVRRAITNLVTGFRFGQKAQKA
jgi:transposase